MQDIRVWKWGGGSGHRTECPGRRLMAMEVAEMGPEAAEALAQVAREGMAAARGARGATVETAVETAAKEVAATA